MNAITDACTVCLEGTASVSYTLECASTFTEPWACIGSTRADLTGWGHFHDTNSPTAAACYRAAHP